MTRPSTPMNHSVSETIRIARIFCILLLVYAHAQPHLPGTPDTLFSSAGLIDFLRLLLGHSSVPLLSLISGYLLAKTLSDRPYTAELRNKFFSLIVPLVLWNLIYIFKEYLKSGFTVVPATQDWLNEVLAITSSPAMMPLYFLRDAFVCFLISPALIHLARKMPGTAITALLLNASFDADGPLFINSAIPLFYFAGCVLQVRKTPIPTQTIPRWPVLVSGLALVLLSAAPLYAPPSWGVSVPGAIPYTVLDVGLRATGCVVFWAIACQLHSSKAGAFLVQFEPIAFFIFCTHGMTAGIWWMVVASLSYAEVPSVFLAYFMITPLLVLISSVVAVRVIRSITPSLLQLLMGGRAPTDSQIKSMLYPLGTFRLKQTPQP